jgi:PLP dependent protein
MAVQENVQAIVSAVAAQDKGVRLLAMSKSQPASAIAKAYEAGQRAFGENYLQEASGKMAALAHLDIEWHYTGRIQSNKVGAIARCFDWVQTVADTEVAMRLNAKRTGAPLNVLIQLNVSDEPQKAGARLQAIKALAQSIHQLPALCLRGLMVIPEKTSDVARLKYYFSTAKQQWDELQSIYSSVDTLSMGMSADRRLAIECGSTMVRIGTAIFGQREGVNV